MSGAILIFVSYMVGSIPFGIIVSDMLGRIDVRKSGSGNIGATNVTRVLGYKAGLLTLFLDAVKAFLATIIASIWHYPNWVIFGCAAAVVVGHAFSVVLKFKGGKGIACMIGASVVVAPLAVFVALSTFVIVVFLTRYVSLASISALVVALISSPVLYPSIYRVHGLLIFYLVLALIRHKDNLFRLYKGLEPKFSFAKR